MVGIEKQGMPHHRFQYNAQTERETAFHLHWDETPFRRYDAQIGRFHGVDALASEYAGITPYQYGFNNPVMFNDPSGLKPVTGVGDGTGYTTTDRMYSDFMGGGSGGTSISHYFAGLGGGPAPTHLQSHSQEENYYDWSTGHYFNSQGDIVNPGNAVSGAIGFGLSRGESLQLTGSEFNALASKLGFISTVTTPFGVHKNFTNDSWAVAEFMKHVQLRLDLSSGTSVGTRLLESRARIWDILFGKRTVDGIEVDHNGVSTGMTPALMGSPDWIGGVGKGVGLVKSIKNILRGGPRISKDISQLAKQQGIRAGQPQVYADKLDEWYGLLSKPGFDYSDKVNKIAAYYHNGIYTISDGHHKVSAALKILSETGNKKPIEMLLKHGSIQNINPLQYMNKARIISFSRLKVK